MRIAADRSHRGVTALACALALAATAWLLLPERVSAQQPSNGAASKVRLNGIFERFAKGEPLRHTVDKEKGY